MNYKIKFHKKVFKFLEKCDIKIAHKFYIAIQELERSPFENSLDIVKLSGEGTNSYRLRISKYRFKYTIIKEDIVIYFYDAWKRWDIYK